MNTTTPDVPSAPHRSRAGLERAGLDRPLVRDSLGAIVLLMLSLLPLGVGGLRLGELDREYPWWVSASLVVAQTLPLVLRRTLPSLALLIIGVAFGVTQAFGADTGLAGLGLLIALYSCAAHLRRGRVAVAAASLVGYVILVAILIAEDSPEEPIDWVTFAAVLAVPWIAGELVRRWRVEHSARLERAAADADRAARSLLARDLHDIVTHHVTAMVMQAESARYLSDTPEGAVDRDTILATVGSTGRLALTELRTLLGALDPDASPQPQARAHAQPQPALAVADEISSMVSRLQQTGYPISLEVNGPVHDVSAEITGVMRSVAREAVTNAMKHARGEEVRLVISATDRAVELVVTNVLSQGSRPMAASHESDAGADTADGRGTSGMKSRVADAGGLFSVDMTGDQYRATARWVR